ncbi:nuclear transport factor 2 family protein [Polaribacter litorisediminis]|uniref:nuclear transport factor 2 family protein n=1 Tax=Polaribacter litorisediminis TaxID=1908341 RepID=UPI001CBA80E3|nr:nuclear transport factor 2 family protein [Polaribacter litorisediminis]UAM97764.1 nuclear transport factor 2 family protein [Polaribacter litorisediminis]
MKNLCSFSLLVLLFISCNSVKEISLKENRQIQNTVNTTLNNWHLAAAEANFDAYFDKMDRNSVFIGTDASENWSKEEFAAFSKPYFDRGKAWNFKTLERNIFINASGDFVWFDELLDTWMGTCRGAGVLEKQGTTWKIKHYVLSVAIPNEDVEAVIAAKKKSDALFLEKFKN